MSQAAEKIYQVSKALSLELQHELLDFAEFLQLKEEKAHPMASASGKVAQTLALLDSPRYQQRDQLHPDVIRFSGIIPAEVDAQAEYAQAIEEKHQ